jgi:hypothetical protein
VVLRSFELLTLASVNPTLTQSRRHPRPPRRVALDPHTFQKIRLATRATTTREHAEFSKPNSGIQR